MHALWFQEPLTVEKQNLWFLKMSRFERHAYIRKYTGSPISNPIKVNEHVSFVFGVRNFSLQIYAGKVCKFDIRNNTFETLKIKSVVVDRHDHP